MPVPKFLLVYKYFFWVHGLRPYKFYGYQLSSIKKVLITAV